MSDAQKPVIAFVPGAWHLPNCFDSAREALKERGFDSIAVSLPSVGAEPPTLSLSDDVTAVRKALEDLLEQGKQIVVVAHSYGGLVGAGAVEGLGYSLRQKVGKPGGVIMLVYMTAFVAMKGQTVLELLGGTFPYFVHFTDNYCHSANQGTVFYNDIAPEEQKKLIAQLKHMPKPAFLEGVSYEPWHELPCSYILCERDAAVPNFAQEVMAKVLGDETAPFRMDASHSPFLSMPGKVAEAIESATREGVRRSGVEV